MVQNIVVLSSSSNLLRVSITSSVLDRAGVRSGFAMPARLAPIRKHFATCNPFLMPPDAMRERGKPRSEIFVIAVTVSMPQSAKIDSFSLMRSCSICAQLVPPDPATSSH